MNNNNNKGGIKKNLVLRLQFDSFICLTWSTYRDLFSASRNRRSLRQENPISSLFVRGIRMISFFLMWNRTPTPSGDFAYARSPLLTVQRVRSCSSVCMSAGMPSIEWQRSEWIPLAELRASGCPHSGPERHGNGPALRGHSSCQPGQSLTLLGYHPGKVHWETTGPFWTVSNHLRTGAWWLSLGFFFLIQAKNI